MNPPPAYESLAGILIQTLLDPSLTNAQVVEALEQARRDRIPAVILRACDIDLGVRALAGSPVLAGAIVGYPYGFSSTSVKLYEARDLLRRGAREIGVVVAASRLRSREFQHIQTELNQLSEACRGEGAALTVYWDAALLTAELQVIACTCAERAEVSFVAAAGDSDLSLLRKHLPDEIGVQAPGASTLDQALGQQSLGYTRLTTTAAASILDDWKRRIAPTPTT